MDQKERVDNLFVAIRSALAGVLPGIWTALPGIVQSYDAVKQTCSVQPGVQVNVTDKTGAKKNVNLPLLVDVPVQFLGGGDWVMTMPIVAGDEGLVVFASRCIDAWWQNGGVQPQAEMRMHDLSDGFLIPGFRSQPRKLVDVNTSQMEFRNLAGTFKFASTNIGFRVTGALEINGPLHLGGQLFALDGAPYAADLQTTGNVIAGFEGPNQVTLQSHTHPPDDTPPNPETV